MLSAWIRHRPLVTLRSGSSPTEQGIYLQKQHRQDCNSQGCSHDAIEEAYRFRCVQRLPERAAGAGPEADRDDGRQGEDKRQ